MRFLISAVALLFGGLGLAWAQSPGGQSSALPSAAEFSATLLPEMKGVVSWKTLSEVTPVRQKDRFVPQFSKGITELDKKEVRLQGFMMPLDIGEKQARFLLTAVPPGCAFCLPAGPDALVEVRAKTPLKSGLEPIVVSGRFVVLKDDPMGLYYRLTDAVPVTP